MVYIQIVFLSPQSHVSIWKSPFFELSNFKIHFSLTSYLESFQTRLRCWKLFWHVFFPIQDDTKQGVFFSLHGFPNCLGEWEFMGITDSMLMAFVAIGLSSWNLSIKKCSDKQKLRYFSYIESRSGRWCRNVQQLTNCFRIFSINRRNTIFATENKRSLTKPLFYQPIEGAPILRLPISSVQIEPSALCSMFPDSSLDAVRIESVA